MLRLLVAALMVGAATSACADTPPPAPPPERPTVTVTVVAPPVPLGSCAEARAAYRAGLLRLDDLIAGTAIATDREGRQYLCDLVAPH